MVHAIQIYIRILWWVAVYLTVDCNVWFFKSSGISAAYVLHQGSNIKMAFLFLGLRYATVAQGFQPTALHVGVTLQQIYFLCEHNQAK